jgi:hypothetical protein
MGSMEKRILTPYVVVIILMVLTSLALAFTVDVSITDVTALKMELPGRVGEWTGYEVRFCQNPQCRQEHKLLELQGGTSCPSCGSDVDIMSLGERQLLPADTILLKKRYFNENGDDIFVSVVFSGKERVSIHRPQICLAGQGRRIQDSYVLDVPIKDRKDELQVMVLDIIHPVTAPGGKTYELPRYYVYWFVGKDRETPYHLERMLWMGLDRVFRNVAHRWAYIAVGGARSTDSEEHKERIRRFLADFYPQMLTD